MALNFEADIRRVLAKIPRGTVLTYGEVAKESGHPAASRAVGNFLARGEGDLPWWRVVTAKGRLVPGNEHEHAKRLRAEGVRLVNGRVHMYAGRLLCDRAVERDPPHREGRD
jgi:methylated-DNA-protein-cysteine methyltransferase related protein